MWNIVYYYVEVLCTFKFQYSTCRKVMFSVFLSILCAHTEFYEAFFKYRILYKELGS